MPGKTRIADLRCIIGKISLSSTSWRPSETKSGEIKMPYERDWENAASYRDLERAGALCRAWEFLRRNPRYQNAYAEWEAIPERLKEAKFRPDDNTDLLICDPQANPHETVGQYMKRHERKLGYTIEVRSPEPGEFHLEEFVDPHLDCDSGKVKFTRLIECKQYRPKKHSSAELKAKEVGEVVVRFDLKFALAPQLKAAKEQLSIWQAELKEGGEHGVLEPRDQWRLHIVYLRVLDARGAGAGPAKIADVLAKGQADPDYAPDKKDVANYIKAAETLRDKTYFHVALRG